MTKLKSHLVKFNDKDEADFQLVKKETGFGATKMLRAMVQSLKKTIKKDEEID